MHALAAGEHGKADKAQIGQMPFHIHCCFSYHIEVEALVRIKIQNHTIGLFHITGERTPAVKFYSAHLDASGDAVSIGDIKIRLLFPIFFPDLHMANMFPDTSCLMLRSEEPPIGKAMVRTGMIRWE